MVSKNVEVCSLGDLPEFYHRSHGFLKLERQFLNQRIAAADFSNHSSRMLDLACGTGRLNKLLGNYLGLISLDISFPMLRYNKSSSSGQFLVQSNALHLPFKDNLFKLVVLSMNSITCFTNDQIVALFQEIKRVLSDDGVLIFDQINPKFIHFELSFEPVLTDGSFKASERLGPQSINGARLLERRYEMNIGEQFFVEELVTLHDKKLLYEKALSAGFNQCTIWDGYTKSIAHKQSSRWVFELRA